MKEWMNEWNGMNWINEWMNGMNGMNGMKEGINEWMKWHEMKWNEWINEWCEILWNGMNE